MPYPHSNDLGKNPPPGSAAAGSGKIVDLYEYYNPKYKAKVLGSFEDLVNKEVTQISAELKAEQQKKMMEQLFGAKPTTIKFPGVHPVQFKGDFPKHPEANKWGKPDLSAIPDQGPSGAWHKGTLSKIDELLKEVYTDKYGPKTYPAISQSPKPVNFMGFTKPATTLGDENSFEITMQFAIDGLAACDDKKLYAKQLVSKEFIYGSYGKSATEKIVDDMLRQIKLQIMEQIKKGK